MQIYFVPGFINDTYPPDFTTYLLSVTSSIGVDVGVRYAESNLSVYNAFGQTGMWTIIYHVSDGQLSLLGDWMSNARPNLETVINAGVGALHH